MVVINIHVALDQDRALDGSFGFAIDLHAGVHADGRAVQCAIHQAYFAAVCHEVGDIAAVHPISPAVDNRVCDRGAVVAEEAAVLNGEAVDQPGSAVEVPFFNNSDVSRTLAAEGQIGVITVRVDCDAVVVPAMGVKDDRIAPVTPVDADHHCRLHIVVFAVLNGGLVDA